MGWGAALLGRGVGEGGRALGGGLRRRGLDGEFT